MIVGPTASGKSACAIDIAREFDGVIINADSMQVYRDLRILTARPDLQEEAQAPHRLYGVIPASEPCSAGRWREMALAEVEAAATAGKLPILVGGTGLYVESLLYGIAAMPEVPESVRALAMDRIGKVGGHVFRLELAALDPFGAAKLDPGDTQRLVRAYEIVKATGTPQHVWQGLQTLDPAPVAPVILKLLPERPGLYQLCDARLDKMVTTGGLEEVQALAAQNLDPMLPAMKAVGIPPLLAHIRGEMSLLDALEIAKRDTRRYAKRQLTWFRNRMQTGYAFNAQYSERLAAKIFSIIRKSVLTKKD